MNKTLLRFTFINLPVSITRSAIVGTVVLWVILSGVALALLTITPLDALIVGFLGVLVHWLSELLHQFGHSLAARRTGYPSSGIRLWFILAMILYPRDEPELAAKIHIQRALGGPILSAFLAVLCLVWFLAWRELGDIASFIAGFALFENIVVFTIGALFPPLKFGGFSNDGATILYWLRQK